MEKEIFLEIKKLNMFLNMRFQKIRKDHINNFSMAEGIIIRYLFENEKNITFQKDIEDDLHFKKSRLSKILSSMEEDELIKRESVKEDARLKQIVLGEKAKTLNKNILKNKQELENIILKDIDSKDLEVFYSVVDKIVENLKIDN
ncbi:MarR family transcriptional regulator [Peptostreptococcaceae bacterium OttesenSCG-928-C18]|nr:MarR family transcriptional regulator [Peptostreptococcaceae bacterium OttesenSCG-928-C18]